MKELTDDELLLFYYGEHESPDLGRRIAESEALSARLEALTRDLELLDHTPVPETPLDIGERVWDAIAPALPGQAYTRPVATPSNSRVWLNWLLTPRLSFAGVAALGAVALMSFWLGQRSAPSPDLPLLEIDAQRLLAARTAEHLMETEQLLTQVANRQGAGHPDEWIDAALVSNRIYRSAAEAAGDRQLADLLADIELLLIQLANAPESVPPVDASLLFRIRVINQEVPNETAI